MPESRRRAKIVCTLGPACRSDTVLRRMIQAGMDVARLNFSHGDHDEHTQAVEAVRRLSAECGREVAILQDLQGPKVRIGALAPPGIRLKRGEVFTLTTRRGVGEAGAVSVSYRQLPGDLGPGNIVLLDDGLIQLRVTRIEKTEITTEVVIGGTLTSRKGLNVPGRRLSTPSLTAKDKADLRLGLDLGVDFVALSFVRDAADMDRIKRFIAGRGHDTPVIAKLEKPQAIENIDAIMARADGIMVARGDLGVELPPEEVPVIQKDLIGRARLAGKPVITATQMLESMVHNKRPTRAEASDVANAVFDGTDAVMLSAETASGKYPVDSIRMMVRIIKTAEKSRAYRVDLPGGGESVENSIADSIGRAAARASIELNARIVGVFTSSGGTARLVSKYRPRVPIFAFTPFIAVARRLRLSWGVHPRCLNELPSTDGMMDAMVHALQQERQVRRGDLIVITAGTPVGRPGTTNFLKIHRIE